MEAKELEQLLAKVGGKYKLVTLYQKRMRELQRGMPRLIEGNEGSMWDVVSREIMTSKVDLLMGEEAETMRKELALREAEELADAEAKGKRERLEAPKAAPAEAPAKA
jgi:DNA-directed RNA polymerase subunit K/omega